MHDLKWLTVIFHSLKLFLLSKPKSQKTRTQLYCTCQMHYAFFFFFFLIQLAFCSVPHFFFFYWGKKKSKKSANYLCMQNQQAFACNLTGTVTSGQAVWPGRHTPINPLLLKPTGATTHRPAPKPPQRSVTSSSRAAATGTSYRQRNDHTGAQLKGLLSPPQKPISSLHWEMAQPPVTKMAKLHTPQLKQTSTSGNPSVLNLHGSMDVLSLRFTFFSQNTQF